MRDSGPILVPLDGSELGERALPHARALAKALRARLILLSAWEGPERELGDNFPALASETERTASGHFGQYHREVRERLDDADVEALVRRGDPVDVIARVATETHAALIVMATHGRSGVGRWVYGSTASQLIRQAPVPIVAIGPAALQRAVSGVGYAHLMVPLDGSPAAEAALPAATLLAGACGARLSLVRAAQWAASAYPNAMPEIYLPQVDEELTAGAKAYLQRKQAELDGAKVESFIVRGAAADSLLEFVEKENVDLIVMTTHARTGIARLALGSIADRMLQAVAPVMLIRPDAT